MKLAADGGYDAVQMRDVVVRSGRRPRHEPPLLRVEGPPARRVPRSSGPKEIQRRVHAAAAAWRHRCADRVVDVLRCAIDREAQPQLTAALLTAILVTRPRAVSDCQRQIDGDHVRTAPRDAPMDGLDADLKQGVIDPALNHIWFSALLGRVNGWASADLVGADLESAAPRLLLRDA